MSRLRTSLGLIVLLVAVAALAGCTSTGGADPAALNGAWVLESFGAPQGLTPADPSVTSELILQAGKASGTGGVNSFSGTYEAKDDASIVFGPLASTQMAGEEKAMQQEGAFFSAIQDARSFEINDGKLVLSDTGNNTLIVLAPK